MEAPSYNNGCNLVWEQSPLLLLATLLLSGWGIHNKNRIIASLGIILSVILYHFHRNPIKCIPDNCSEKSILSPSDGEIIKITCTDKYYHIAIFLSPLDVHLQYAPAECVVISQRHYEGSFHPAYLFEKSQYNERMVTHLTTKHNHDLYLIQIAGMVARRIVSFCNEGSELLAGEPFGMIKFSSRVDLVIPRKSVERLECHEGQKIKGVETILGYFT